MTLWHFLQNFCGSETITYLIPKNRRFCKNLWWNYYLELLSLLNKVPRVPKYPSALVPKCSKCPSGSVLKCLSALSAQVPKYPSVLSVHVPKYLKCSSAGVPKCPPSTGVPSKYLSALQVPECLSTLWLLSECPSAQVLSEYLKCSSALWVSC